MEKKVLQGGRWGVKEGIPTLTINEGDFRRSEEEKLGMKGGQRRNRKDGLMAKGEL